MLIYHRAAIFVHIFNNGCANKQGRSDLTSNLTLTLFPNTNPIPNPNPDPGL